MAPIIRHEALTEDLVRLTLQAPLIAAAARPGQFVMLKAGSGFDPLLRRPISIHQCLENGNVQVIIKVLGKGTRWLAESRTGQVLDLIGPLGRGFRLEGPRPFGLVGGGVGIAPLLFLARAIMEGGAQLELPVLLGARTGRELQALAQDFQLPGLRLLLATDDGSLGHHGPITELMNSSLAPTPAGLRIAACGPYPMLKAVARQCRCLDFPGQVSLETVMACGMGACLGCALPRPGSGAGYAHVCTDGPVFDLEEVQWR